MNKLNFQYSQGYLKALSDVKNFFEDYSDFLKVNKLYNAKAIPKVLDMLLHERKNLEDFGTINIENDNIVYDKDKKDFVYKNEE